MDAPAAPSLPAAAAGAAAAAHPAAAPAPHGAAAAPPPPPAAAAPAAAAPAAGSVVVPVKGGGCVALVAVTADDAALLAHVRRLFTQYRDALVAAGVPIDSFQDFSGEIAALPGKYAAAQHGALFLAVSDDDVLGCVALRDLGGGVAEVKRLFVVPPGRGRGVGRALSAHIVDVARRMPSHVAGVPYYTSRLVLDTLERLDGAAALYTSLGFRPCAAYCPNPMPDVIYMELPLGSGASDTSSS